MNKSRKPLRQKSPRNGDVINAAKKKSKKDVSLVWDEEIGSDDDGSQEGSSNKVLEESEDEEETAEQARKR